MRDILLRDIHVDWRSRMYSTCPTKLQQRLINTKQTRFVTELIPVRACPQSVVSERSCDLLPVRVGVEHETMSL